MSRHVFSLNAGLVLDQIRALRGGDGHDPLVLAAGLVEMLGERRRITVHDANNAPLLEDDMDGRGRRCIPCGSAAACPGLAA